MLDVHNMPTFAGGNNDNVKLSIIQTKIYSIIYM